MRVLIDADGCPVVKIAMDICNKNKIEMIVICDTSHVFNLDGIQTIMVDKGADSADFALVNIIQNGDVVVTQDYGLAAMCLSRKAIVLNQNGMFYNDSNIDSLLLARHTAKKIRNAGGRLKGNPKRTQEQNEEFAKALNSLIK